MNTAEVRELAHHLMGAQQTGAIYPREHPRVNDAVRDLYVFLRSQLGRDGRIRLARTGEGFVIDDLPLRAEGDLLASLDRMFARQGIERLVIEPGLRRWEARALVDMLNATEDQLEAESGAQELLRRTGVENVRVGRLRVNGHGGGADLATSLAHVWDLYAEGLAAMRTLRRGLGQTLGAHSLQEAQRIAAGLVGATEEHAEAFVLLQALHRHDAYSYTHSLNVALLSLAMARDIDLPRGCWTELAVAALLHDIGKELVPSEILNKPGRLDPEEWEVMQRHSADGARMLMSLPDVPDLAIVVAHEHQLAYEPDNPDHGRWPLHLVSEIVCLADVYAALRSHRPYREALAPEVAMQVMVDDAHKFDATLFAGFRRMVGSYPHGTLVVLDDGCLAVSLGPGAEEPDRPVVLVVRDPQGEPLEPPLTLDLSLALDPSPTGSVDPDRVGVDPFDYF